ncbi:MAG: tyrosine--tRNA ligase [Pseudomonadales bacterium]|nr:tyrosine--tRNA ligase [Pseudomonadales bacterium]
MDNFLEHLKLLGLVAQGSQEEALAEHLSGGSRTVYCGFDPTADSLHIGNLVPLLALRRFQMAGHRPILLVGGATGLIGDPGGRNSERDLKPTEVVLDYVEKIRVQASQFLDFDCGETSAIVVDNAEWTKDLTAIAFLRDIGKHFSVNAMINKESVRRRIEDDSSGISYTEFSYMILQAYDFVILNRRFDCTIQMGGSDQWGNITSGLDLIRRIENKQAYALTYPLLTKSDGSKFGKSAGGAVWLDAAKTSPYAFFQFWRNADDLDVSNFLKVFTFLDLSEIEKLLQGMQQDPGMRLPQIRLAEEVTSLVHGEQGLLAAQRISEALFSNAIQSLGESDLAQVALDGLPVTKVSELESSLVEVLVNSGLASTPKGQVTAGQARKLIKSNAVSVNGEKVSDEGIVLTRDEALFGKYVIVRKGKKNHHLVVFEG